MIAVVSEKGIRMSSEIERIFDVEDEVVESYGDSFADALSENYLAKFNSFMPSLYNEEFLLDVKGAVVDVRNIPTDEFFVKKQAKETLDVQMVRDQCTFETRLLRVYAAKAFDQNPGVYGTFNFSGLKKARSSNTKMHTFFSNLITVVEENILALRGADFPETKFDELKQLLIKLETEHDEQQSVMRQRVLLTDHRVKALNHLWELMAELSSVREFALPGDAVGQELFALPQRESSSSEAIS